VVGRSIVQEMPVLLCDAVGYFQIAEEHRAQRESAAAAEKTAADAAVAAALNLPLGTHEERIFPF
jgi:hypothetical protein